MQYLLWGRALEVVVELHVKHGYSHPGIKTTFGSFRLQKVCLHACKYMSSIFHKPPPICKANHLEKKKEWHLPSPSHPRRSNAFLIPYFPKGRDFSFSFGDVFFFFKVSTHLIPFRNIRHCHGHQRQCLCIMTQKRNYPGKGEGELKLVFLFVFESW